MKILSFWRETAVLTGLMIALAACAAVSQSPAQPTAVPTAPSISALPSPSATKQSIVHATNEPSAPLATETSVPLTVSPTEPPILADLPDLGAAPEIENEVWVNADAPVTLAASRGKVVLIEFWTFG